jgi:hypothetical protein
MFLCDSDRTPDYLYCDPYDMKVTMIEYTVTNTKAASIQNKESMGKYNPECSVIRQKGYAVDDWYFILALDSDVLELTEALANYLDIKGIVPPEDLFQSLSQLKDEFLYLNWHLNELIPELLTNDEGSKSIKINVPAINPTPVFRETISKAKVSRVSNIFLKKRLKIKSRELLRSMPRKSRTFKFKLNYNFKDDVLYTSLDEDGLNKDQIMSMLTLEDDRLIEHVNIVGSFESVPEPFNKYGETEVDEADLEMRPVHTTYHIDDDYSDAVYYRLGRININTISDYNLEDIVDSAVDTYSNLLREKRATHEKVLFQKKNPFIFMPASGLTKFGKEVVFKSKHSLTNSILSKKVKSPGHNFIDRQIDYDLLTKVEVELSKTWSKIKNVQGIRDMLRGKVEADEEHRPTIEEYKKLKKQFSGTLSEAKRTTYKNRVTVPMSEYKRKFPLEMEHFSKSSSNVFMYPDATVDDLLAEYRGLVEHLYGLEVEPASDRVFSDTEPQGLRLKENCQQMLDLVQEEEGRYLHTTLAKTTQFISNLCYSLMYYSNIKLNKNDFCVDRMGYKNALVIVRGGKKIISSRRSRLFRVAFPVSNIVETLCSTSTNEFMTIEGKRYCLTPWRQFNQSLLKKGLELHASFGNYYLSGLLENGLSNLEWERFCSLKVLNMLSQKRKMEVWFSSLRYIYFNSTGTHTDPESLFKSMVEVDFDSYFYLIQRMFCRGYTKLVESVKNGLIYDLFYETTYDNFDLCYEKFEETAYMAKAPVDPVNEHLGNLYKVLDLHNSFKQNYPSNDPIDILERSRVDLSDPEITTKLKQDDFKFDPKICYLIGKLASDMILSSTTKQDLSQKFSKIVSESMTGIATSKGMRSKEGSFWGKKGFDVVFSKLGLAPKVKKLVSEFPFGRKDYDQVYKEANRDFKDALEATTDLKMEFDMKDKTQYKGAREIYVMSDETKLLQQPLENFFKQLCRLIPNELMHKKSHVRPKLIHRKVFEDREISGQTMYCTLDCTKWAPKSNLWKYVYFVNGMREALPEEFYVYFMRVWTLMFKKVVRIQKKYVLLMSTNRKYDKLLTHLKEREDGDYELLMPYSFMMGIFNYLSSLFHAMSQIYFNKVVSSPKQVYFNLMAHSDDSGGSVVASSYEKCLNMFSYYEKFQRLCNHLLSRKKSSLSRDSFELISIMYYKRRLIPMTHKFLANVALAPTGEGWYSDICSVVGKVIDAFNNGASILQCYMLMLAQGELVRKSYHMPRSKLLSTVPIHFGGVFNMHPLHLILIGSCSQEVMLDLVESPRSRNFRINTYNLFCGDYVIGRGCPVKTRSPYFVNHSDSLRLDEEQSEVLSNLSVMTDKGTLPDAIRYYNSIKMNKFKYALLNIDSFKILYSTLFYKLDVIVGTEKKVSLQDLCHNYLGFNILGLSAERNFLGYSNDINYLRASEGIGIDFDKNTVFSDKSCKPMIYHTFMNLGLDLSYEDVSNLKLFNAGPEYAALLKNEKKWKVMTDWVLQNMGEGSTKDKLKHLSTLERSDTEKLRSCYLFIPSGISIDTPERFWTYVNFYCSRRQYISESKPQFYSMENFELWNLPYDSMKHYYLMVKVMLSGDNPDTLKAPLLNSFNGCRICQNKSSLKSTLEELCMIRNLGPYERFSTKLPFAIYSRPQYRAQNVWYGSSDFKIVTQFGNIVHREKEGVTKTTWEVVSESFLDQMWHLYRLFCDSRGIQMPKKSYDNTGFLMRRLAFNTLDVPFFPSENDYQLILENSDIRLTGYIESELQTDWNGKPTFEGEPVDFNIYHVYDINENFYIEHNLEAVRKQILPNEEIIQQSILLNNFLESKIYSVLSLDQTHKGKTPLREKYKNLDLLGSLGSFTRALCLADEMSVLKFRSSVTTSEPTAQILEMQTVQNTPLIDLYNSSSMSRVTYSQQKVLLKLAEDEELEAKDFEILNSMASKLGLVSSATMLVRYRAIANSLEPVQFAEIPRSMLNETLKLLLDSITASMEHAPVRRTEHQWEGSKREFWNNFKTLWSISKKRNRPGFKTQFPELATHLTKGMFRSNNDNERRFWNVRRSGALSSVLTFSYLNAQNIYFVTAVMISAVFRDQIQEIEMHLEGMKEYRQAKVCNLDQENPESFEEFEEEYIDTDITDKVFPPLVADEDGLDSMLGKEVPEEYEKRLWSDGPREVLYIRDRKELIRAQEYTASRNFPSITIHYLADSPNFTWLGPSNDSLTNIGGLAFYTSEYPGRTLSKPSVRDEKLMMRKVSRRYEDAQKLFLEKLAKKKADENIKEAVSEAPETLKEYLEETFRKVGVTETSYVRSWIGEQGAGLSYIIGKVLSSAKAANVGMRRRNKNYLPGFSGVLQDPRICSELSSLFGSNYHFLATGSMKLNKKVLKKLQSDISFLYFRVNAHHKAFLTFLMSILKEVVAVDGSSDAEFSDSMMGFISDIQDLYENVDDIRDTTAPDPMPQLALLGQYQQKWGVDWESLK